jgi:DNA-binding CsgD family transcriptional regulator
MSSDAEEQAVENADLARTMATLHPRHAQVLLLDAAGHSREDIAKILDISPAAVGMLLQRARRAARARWAKVVAAFMVLGVRVRKMQQVPSDSTSALVASVVSISIVAALGSTNASEYARAMPNAGLTPTRVVTPKLDPSGGLPGSLRGVTRVAPIGAVHAARWFLGANVTKADPGSECVRATDLRVFCPQPITDRKGRDHICIKHTGRSCIGTGESVTPVCQDVRRNPAVDCQREGDPHWTFRRPTKQRTLGGLL